nr:MAG TPA: MARTX multifunctional-autoprocessing repeats-in-toxin holotoxin N-terminal region [Caudoviricetes sp.]
MIYAYHNGRFWRWDEGRSIWKESHLMAQKFERARAALKTLTPESFFSDGAEFALLDEYEISLDMTAALRDAKPCKNAPIDPVEEDSSSGVPAPSHSEDVAAQCGNTPLAPTFDFSALGDLSEQAAAADQQFDLHYGAAQDEYLISCIYLARIHALTAKAGRYGGGTWTKWYESKGLSEGSARTMVKNGDAFNSATVAELKQLPELTRKDLNLIARSGCAAQVVEASGDSQRVQELLAQLKAEKDRADTAEKSAQNARKENAYFKELVKSAEAQTSKDAKKREEAESRYESALADINGLKEQNAQLKERADSAEAREEEAWKMQSKAEARAKDAENQLAGSRQVAEAAKRRADKWQAEAEAARKQPIAAVVDEEEVERRANQKAHDIAEDLAADMTADLREQLERATSSSEQEAHSSYDAVLLADRSFQNIGKMVVPSLRRLPPEQREQLTSMLVHTLGQIQGEVSRCL